VRPFSYSLPAWASLVSCDRCCELREGQHGEAGSTADDSDCIANAESPAVGEWPGSAALRGEFDRAHAICDIVRQLQLCRPGFPGWLDSGIDLGAARRPGPAGIGSGTSVHQARLGLRSR
jgi:hypothetical protein